ncbi:abnormal spindle-like microcephaly-associated protein homolog [Dysidea avara]|uniref:abnormal spindle-like microcephaly-associated protein homolog n=1 Tax=Dysidea avara TaxID=196820 RepID=UPI00332F79CC
MNKRDKSDASLFSEDGVLATSTPFTNGSVCNLENKETDVDPEERGSTFVVEKENKPSFVRKTARKQWNIPNQPVLFSAWTKDEGVSFADTVSPKPIKKSVTFTICNGDSDSSDASATEAASVNQTQNKKPPSNRVPLTNKLNSAYVTSKNARRSLQNGPSVAAEKKKVQQRRSLDVKKTTKSTTVGLPQRKLTLKKPTGQAQPRIREPMPFACRNALYDEHWSSKQERAFTRWLNYVLVPVDNFGNTLPSSGRAVENVGQLTFHQDEKSGGHNVSSVSRLQLRRREARIRQQACQLYQSQVLEDVFLRLEVEVESRRLTMRPDRTIHSDIGLRERLIEVLNSYSIVWLRLGVEVLLGEILPSHSTNGRQLVDDYATYCVARLCEDDAISQAYTLKTGSHGAGYEEALLQYAFRKLLMMVIFLDKAKMSRLIDNDPCLFVKTATIKSSRQVLVALSDIFLCGEGDIVKHLRLLNYTLSYMQRPLDEYDFGVTNLAVDLRDGIRLCRLTEMLTNNWELSGQMRVPTASKTQKLHNVEVVLKELRQHVSIPHLVTAQAIVMGHKELTLSLLWSIIFHFKVDLQLDVEELRKEVEVLKQHKPHPIALANFSQRRCSLEPSIFFKSASISMLLQWCNSVCAIYGVPVTNFTTSFSDGRVFCYLLHHYHPHLLPLAVINNETSLTAATQSAAEEDIDSPEEELVDGWTKNFSPTTNKEKTLHIANEKANFKLLSEKMQLLGGVPPLVMSKDMIDTMPDEKVVIAYTSYLCRQLLSISQEVRAAIVLQTAWRNRHSKLERRRKMVLREKAAVILQAHVRCHLIQAKYQRMKQAAVVIQQHWRARTMMLHQRGEFLLTQQAVLVIQQWYRRQRSIQRERAAQLIQATFRGHLKFCQYTNLKQATCVIQSAYRRHLAVLEAERTRRHCAVVKIQSTWRRFICHKKYIQLKTACLTIQRCYRAKILAETARTTFTAKRSAAITVQAAFKGWIAHRTFVEKRNAAIVFQQRFRALKIGRRDKEDYQRTLNSVILIQHAVRARLCRKHQAAIKLQAGIRGYLQRCRYLNIRCAVLTIQSQYRAHKLAIHTRQCYRQLQQSCIVLQAAIRSWKRRQEYKRMQSAAVTVQSWYKGVMEQRRYVRMKQACDVITRRWRAVQMGRAQRQKYLETYSKLVQLQAVIRGWRCRQWVELCHSSAAVIQQTYRAHLARRHYASMKLQAAYRGVCTRRSFLRQRQAACTIQAHYRAVKEGRQLRQEFQQMRATAVAIQASFRCYIARKNFLSIKRAALVAQTNWRRYKQQKEFTVTKQAALCIQRWYRWASHARQVHEDYLKLKWATVTIQRCFKAYKHRRQLMAAVKIQSVVRCVLTRRSYLRTVHAVITIQSFTRGCLVRSRVRSLTDAVRSVEKHYQAKLVGRKVQKDYRQTRTACITLQAAIRGWKRRQEYKRMQSATVTIQSWYKGVMERRRYVRMKQACDIITHRWRAVKMGRSQRQKYLETYSKLVQLQAVIRGWMCRQWVELCHTSAAVIQQTYRAHLARRHSASVKLQAAYRGVCARRSFLRQRQAACTIQVHYRAAKEGRRLRQEFQQMCTSALTIQAFVRGYIAHKNFLSLKRAALVAQTNWRRYKQQKEFTVTKQAVLCVQRWYRWASHGRQVREDYLKLKWATVTIQQCFKAYKHRRQLLAAVKIQSVVRCVLTRRSYLRTVNAVITIQSFTRGCLVRSRVRSLTDAVRSVEKHYQAKFVGRKVQKDYQQTRTACITLQAAIRGWKRRQEYKRMQSATVTMQSWYKGVMERRSYVRIKQACDVITHRWRAVQMGRAQRQKYLETYSKLVQLQAVIRGWRCRQWVELCHSSAAVIQQTYRAHLARRHYASVKLQAAYRGVCARRSFLRQRQAACTIQAHYRAVKEGRQLRQEFQQMRATAVAIQASFRCYIARKNFLSIKRAALVAQTNWRRYKQQKEFTVTKQAALCIQRWYRWASHARQVHEDYLKLKWATVTIQRCFKAYKHRRQLMAAVKIQSVVRCVLTRRSYLRTVNAVITIQSFTRGCLVRSRVRSLTDAVRSVEKHYQAKLVGRKVQKDYQQTRTACITLQAAIRGWKRRQEYKRMQSATVTIQSWYKGVMERRRYVRMKQACDIITHRWRAVKMGRSQRQKYLETYSKLVQLQAVIRGWMCRQWVELCHTSAAVIQQTYRAHLARRHSASVKLQAAYRGVCARRSFLRQRQAACTIQVHYRAAKEGRRLRQEFQQMCTSALTIQAFVRGYIAHKNFLSLKRAVLVAQTNWRRYKQQKEFTVTKQAVLCVQRWYRWASHGRQVCENYLKLKWATVTIQRSFKACKQRRQLMAAVKIQSVVRCVLTRRSYLRTVNAVITIQAFTRGYLVQSCFKNLTAAVRKVEELYKAKLVGRQIKREYQQIREGTITLQAAYKGWKVRRNVAELQTAVLTVERSWLARQQRMSYLQQQCSAVVIQKCFRSYLLARQVHDKYVEIKSATRVLQRFTRGLLARKLYRSHVAARKIQSCYRGYKARHHFLRLKNASIALQSWARMCAERRKYLTLKEATMVIQSRARTWFSGRAVLREYQQLRDATIVLQAAYRAKKQRNVYLNLKENVITIQAWYRMCVARRQYLCTRRAAVLLQTRFRSYLLGKATNTKYKALRTATIVVQSHFRGHLQRTHYLQLRQASITIQSTFKMYRCRREYNSKKSAAIILQKYTRTYLSGKEARECYVGMKGAAVLIQSAYRRHRTERRNCAAIKIQSHVRQYLNQKNYTALKSAAISIQKHWRGQQCLQQYQRIRDAVLCLQQSYRAHVLRVKIHQEQVERHRAATLIQAAYRAHVCHMQYTSIHHAAVVLQSHVRRLRAEKEFSLLRNSTIFIQQKWRAMLLARTVQAEFHSKQMATLTIQQWYRSCVYTRQTRCWFVQVCTASVTLQRVIRKYLHHKQQQRELAATCIQRAFRHHRELVKRKRRADYIGKFAQVVLMNISAIQIQRTWHNYQQCLLQQKKLSAAIKLQSWIRMTIVRRRYHKLLLSVSSVQHICRNHIHQVHQQKLHKCATKIQACWRGYFVRCQTTIQIHNMRERLRCANSVERRRVTLRDQMPVLLELLMKGKYLTHGSSVLEKLELITRLSDSCSLVLVETGALPALYAVVNGTNRNRASLLLVKITLQILLNLTRWPCTSADVLRCEGLVSAIVGLMQKIYVSQSDIMQLSCHLLSVFGKQQTELVRNHLSPETRRLNNMAVDLRKKLLILSKKGQALTVPFIQQQQQQFQSSLSLLEQILSTPALTRYTH